MDVKTAAAACRPLVERCLLPVEGDEATSTVHLLEMCDAITAGVVSGEKAHRWLGWVQGVLCCRGAATLDELKAINFAS